MAQPKPNTDGAAFGLSRYGGRAHVNLNKFLVRAIGDLSAPQSRFSKTQMSAISTTTSTTTTTAEVTLYVAFAFGVFVNLIKAADFIFRPHQQKRIQESIEYFTLRLEYFDTTKILNTLSNPNEITKATRGIFRYMTLLMALELVLTFLGVIVGVFPIYAVLFALSSLVIMLVLFRSGWVEMSMRWFIGGARLTSFCIRYAVLLAVEFIPLRLFLPKHLENLKHFFLFMLAIGLRNISLILLLLPFLGIYSIAMYIGLWWIIVELGRLILINAIKALRAIAWRIIEFNKGAVAALVLIVTVLLGIATQLTDCSR